MSDQYAPKPVTEEDVLRALINLHKRADRCMLNDREPCGQDLELLGKSLTKQLERLQLELEEIAQWDAHGEWLDDGWSLHCEEEAYSPKEFAKAEAEHSALQPKAGTAPKDFF